MTGFATTNRSGVEEVSYGMYVWQNPEGEIFADDDGNVMNVFVWEPKHRPAARKALTEAAKVYGAGEGAPVWWSGKRPITDEELQEQQSRERLGLVPDPLDVPALKDEARRLHNER